MLDLECQNRYHSRHSRPHSHRHRPSALGMSDPVIESQEILETQEFPSILKILNVERTKGTNGAKGMMRNGENGEKQ